MPIQMNIAEAKAKLSALIEAAERGEEVIIARNGEPVARVYAANPKRVRLGILKELYGWTGPATPIEAFAPDPEDLDWTDKPLVDDSEA
jgi:prevent-host-death family protein